ncbi:TetR family transcriptional regulator [Nonomuraea sp. NPDC050786]|uniref:TetR family transcriptional regulator n=1 Tax=Nonomuraea sp. NPDC050786 TaxID=3154840 RepID=UPI00340C2060
MRLRWRRDPFPRCRGRRRERPPTRQARPPRRGRGRRWLIASRAGVGVGTLYRRFPDRSVLLAALAEQ